jgi:hypothetical protein
MSKHFSAILFCLIAYSGFAQQNVSSPYSRYGLGDLTNTSFAHYTGMGSANIALADSFLLNISNPASLSFIRKHQPIFDIGISGQFITNRSTTESAGSSAMGLKNIALGFPINNRWGFAFGILPYSNVGYNVVNVINEPGIGDVTYTFTGSGGLNKVFMSHAFKIVNKPNNILSIGATANYLFGNIYRERKAVYPAALGLLHTKVRHNTIVSDFLFEAGLIYKTKVGEKSWFQTGLTYGFGSEVFARQEVLAYSFRFTETESLVDTIQYIDTTNGYLNLPRRIGYGMSYVIIKPGPNKENRRFIFSAQYELQDWAKYTEVFGENVVSDSLRNSSGFAFGFAFTPYTNPLIDLTKSNLFDIMTYRVGFRYNNTYLQLNETPLSQYGISFGVTIPLIHSSSMSSLNLGFEFGKRGTTENNLLMEDYFQFNVGFSVCPGRNDGWFYKRKFD